MSVTGRAESTKRFDFGRRNCAKDPVMVARQANSLTSAAATYLNRGSIRYNVTNTSRTVVAERSLTVNNPKDDTHLHWWQTSTDVWPIVQK